MFPNQTLGKNIYIYTSDPGERRDGAACGPGNSASCSQRGDSAGNTQPGSHLGEMRMEAEECESSPCVPEALKLFRAGAVSVLTCPSVCLSVETLFWKELVQSGGEVGIQRHLHLVCGFFSS